MLHTFSTTLFFAGLCALLQCLLTALVIARRARTGVDFMDGGDPLLLRRMRAHGNFVETVPIALLLLALLEFRGLAVEWLWILGGCLLLGRLLHAFSLLTSNRPWSRRGGMALTLCALSTLAVLCLWMAFSG
jgi:uncharacterized membrane protein YecN with MAPEG domain